MQAPGMGRQHHQTPREEAHAHALSDHFPTHPDARGTLGSMATPEADSEARGYVPVSLFMTVPSLRSKMADAGVHYSRGSACVIDYSI